MVFTIFQDHPKVFSKAEVTNSRFSLERVTQTQRIPKQKEEGQIADEGVFYFLILILIFLKVGAASDDQSGRKVNVQKKAESRTRKLRKKARGSSRQCKDGRAGIKRTQVENDKAPRLDVRCTPASPAAAEVLPPGFPWQRGMEVGIWKADRRAWRNAACTPGRSSRLGLRGGSSPTPPRSRRAASAGPRPSFSCKCSILSQTVPARRGVGAQWT